MIFPPCFSFASPATLHFGRGQRHQTAALAAGYGASVLLVHGATAARADWLLSDCITAGLQVSTLSCSHEPALPDLEAALAQIKGVNPDVVIALGGGSVMDFAKALSALIPCKGPAISYLEIVGDGRPLDHPPLPMIALPTTAGTGAEVTKNAVITVPDRAIKVSLRDPRMIPCCAIVDADLMQGAPKSVALASALDAVTQVIEPYLSTKATPMTDALCRAAIPVGLNALRNLVEQDAPDAWDQMAWVSTCGGLALANSGLGAVHGFAGVIGGMTNAPHGEICGTLLPAVLNSHLSKAQPQTDLFDRLHWVTAQIDTAFGEGLQNAGIAALTDWSRIMGLRGLGALGLPRSDYAEVARLSANASSMKGNPFVLSQSELKQILTAAD